MVVTQYIAYVCSYTYRLAYFNTLSFKYFLVKINLQFHIDFVDRKINLDILITQDTNQRKFFAEIFDTDSKFIS